MPDNVKIVEIELSKVNADLAQRAASILKTTVETVVSLCLTGSTNPNPQ